MKMLLAIAVATMSLIPLAAKAEDAQPKVFEHAGTRYVYTITKTRRGETLKGWASNTPFLLHVGKIHVNGTIGGTTVSFLRKKVKPLKGTVEVAVK